MSGNGFFQFQAPLESDHELWERSEHLRALADSEQAADALTWGYAAESGFLGRALRHSDTATRDGHAVDAVLDNGLTVEVKCRSPDSGDDLGIDANKFDHGGEPADVFVLLWYHGPHPDDPEMGVFTFPGWATREMVADGYRMRWRRLNYVVSWGELNSCESPAVWRSQMDLLAEL